MVCKYLKFDDLEYNDALVLAGGMDCNIKLLASLFDVELEFRSNEFIVYTDDEEKLNNIKKVITHLIKMIKNHKTFDERDIIYITRQILKNNESQLTYTPKVVGRTFTGKVIASKTIGQHELCDALGKYDIVFAIGPAGTGKTYLAVANATTMLKKGEIKKIILTRPAVEAGESLGYLPGDLKEKIDPYLIPLYDALYDTLGNVQTDKLLERGIIEIAPLAYMRGRTLDNAYIILDEAQNTTSSQMKMFLTRLGFNSKMVITGDITQIDLSRNHTSGLIEASKILKDINEIKICQLSSDDVVRHPLVQKIIESYDKFN